MLVLVYIRINSAECTYAHKLQAIPILERNCKINLDKSTTQRIVCNAQFYRIRSETKLQIACIVRSILPHTLKRFAT